MKRLVIAMLTAVLGQEEPIPEGDGYLDPSGPLVEPTWECRAIYDPGIEVDPSYDPLVLLLEQEERCGDRIIAVRKNYHTVMYHCIDPSTRIVYWGACDELCHYNPDNWQYPHLLKNAKCFGFGFMSSPDFKGSIAATRQKLWTNGFEFEVWPNGEPIIPQPEVV